MSDDPEETSETLTPFYVERAKSGRSACKKCKQKISSGDLRLGKLGYNPFGSGTMKLWHHVSCMFEVFKKQRKTTKKIEKSDDIGGWGTISDEDKNTIKGYLSEEELKDFECKPAATPAPKLEKQLAIENKDDSFRVFRKLCSDITGASSYLDKTSIVNTFFTKGSSGQGFKGNIELWCKSLLPMVGKRVYNLQSKQLVKIFAEILKTDQSEMLEDLERGDVADTIGIFFEKSEKITPAKKSTLSLQEVEANLDYLSKLTRECDQIDHLVKVAEKCTSNDLKVFIRLIKHDLRINAGPKHILEALHPDAYKAFQTSRNLETVVKNAWKKFGSKASTSKDVTHAMDIKISLMTPALPMLAEACTSIEMALTKCPNGLYSEIKYDGERVQLHKQGSNFKYFSRSLKPVLNHKVSHFEKYIPMAFPHGKDLILDCEILLVDTNTGKPLPFGTLGKHKKAEFKDASVCLFVFDCIYFNDKQLIDRPISERRKILEGNMTEIQHRVMFSQMKEIHYKEELEDMVESVLKLGLEGLVFKAIDSTYKPGKRHWLKLKKDYLFGGAMADNADLVVLGAWYGTGKKGGIMSIFLMGCYDQDHRRWVTVTKVHGGHDDQTLDALQTQLKMKKISKDASKIPSWLKCNKTMVPDLVIIDPKESQVWEITGAEFTRNQVHTADGISIRFPRVTRIRNDKTWETATNLSELMNLYRASKDTSGFTLKRQGESGSDGDSMSPKKKQKVSETERTKGKSKSATPEKRFKDNGKNIDGSGSETEVDEDPLPDSTTALTMANLLPDVFVGLGIHFHDNVSNVSMLERYVIAYGGQVFKQKNKNSLMNNSVQVTHVVYPNLNFKKIVDLFKSDPAHVTLDWLLRSIKHKCKQTEAGFTLP